MSLYVSLSRALKNCLLSIFDVNTKSVLVTVGPLSFLNETTYNLYNRHDICKVSTIHTIQCLKHTLVNTHRTIIHSVLLLPPPSMQRLASKVHDTYVPCSTLLNTVALLGAACPLFL